MASAAEPTGPFTPNRDRLIAANETYATEGFTPDVPGAPSINLALVVCMDCRLDPLPMLGLANGEAHVIRNAGGVMTDDVIRSLTLSQRALGTREIVLVHHTQCGVQGIDEAAFKASLHEATGETPSWSVGSFDDAHDDVRAAIAQLKACPFLVDTEHISGFVYDVADGRLHAVD